MAGGTSDCGTPDGSALVAGAPVGSDSGGFAGEVCRVDGGKDSDGRFIRVGGSSGWVELTDSDGEDSSLSGVHSDDMGDERAGDTPATKNMSHPN